MQQSCNKREHARQRHKQSRQSHFIGTAGNGQKWHKSAPSRTSAVAFCYTFPFAVLRTAVGSGSGFRGSQRCLEPLRLRCLARCCTPPSWRPENQSAGKRCRCSMRCKADCVLAPVRLSFSCTVARRCAVAPGDSERVRFSSVTASGNRAARCAGAGSVRPRISRVSRWRVPRENASERILVRSF